MLKLEDLLLVGDNMDAPSMAMVKNDLQYFRDPHTLDPELPSVNVHFYN